MKTLQNINLLAVIDIYYVFFVFLLIGMVIVLLLSLFNKIKHSWPEWVHKYYFSIILINILSCAYNSHLITFSTKQLCFSVLLTFLCICLDILIIIGILRQQH